MKQRNPFKSDPSRTAMIRRAWVADTNRRFAIVRKAVWKYMAVDNELDLDRPTANALFKFETVLAKLKRFRQWLTNQVKAGILEESPITGEPKGQKPWMYKYVDSAYKKGLVRSYIEDHKPELGQKMPHYEGRKEQFLASAFSRPERVSKLQLLYTRSYEDLKGVTDTMATQLSRTLASGMAHGQGPMEIARTMNKQIVGLTKRRARVIARTETIFAHAEGQLDGMEDLGVEEVLADVEISTADDSLVCPMCKGLIGKVFTLEEARGIIPVHPSCRCSWSPVIRLPGGLEKGKSRRAR